MRPSFDAAQIIDEIESRQDEVLRHLEELELRIIAVLAQHGARPAFDEPPQAAAA